MGTAKKHEYLQLCLLVTIIQYLVGIENDRSRRIIAKDNGISPFGYVPNKIKYKYNKNVLIVDKYL